MSATAFDERVAQITGRADYVKPAAWALGVATRTADGRDARHLVPACQLRESLPLRRDDLGGGRRAGAARRRARRRRRRRRGAADLRAAGGRRRRDAHPNSHVLRALAPLAEGVDARRAAAARELVAVFIADLGARARRRVEDAYLRLHLLSHRAVRPHGLNLDGIFGVLPNVVWTNDGPYPVDGFEAARMEALARGSRCASARWTSSRG